MSIQHRKDMAGFREFQIQRLLVLTMLNKGPEKADESYLFAWASGVFPVFAHSQLHEGFEQFFFPTKEMMTALTKRLDGPFIAQELPPTVYDLEAEFEGERLSEWDRGSLIDALRYLSLCRGRFSPDFWPKLTRDAGAPSEANGFFDPFRDWDASPH